MKAIIAFFKSLFKKPQYPGTVITNPPPVSPRPGPLKPPVQTPTPAQPNLIEWTGRAIDITQAFEGNTPWANITGNFDGAGLTCGALGWTIQWFNQQPLVKQFVAAYGENVAKDLMPETWEWYWKLINIKDEDQAIKEDNRISGLSANVKQPYKRELERFWQNARMVQIQKETAAKNMGRWAMDRANEFSKFCNSSGPEFFVFAYYFDQAVLNGTGKNPTLEEAGRVSMPEVWSWMDSETGYLQDDFDNNLRLWKSNQLTYGYEQRLLFAHTKIRADRSREDFDTVVACRRGIIITGQGWVNGRKWDLTEKLGL